MAGYRVVEFIRNIMGCQGFAVPGLMAGGGKPDPPGEVNPIGRQGEGSSGGHWSVRIASTDRHSAADGFRGVAGCTLPIEHVSGDDGIQG